tara:strand:+ start:3933 stop:5030 length:1098 start_codon:yes stop_codon:yes gene_type:complete
MSKDFFKKFTEDTNVKLELYEDYLMKWLPVFIVPPKPIRNTVNIMDLFCGPGKDEEGTLGSPLIALKVLKVYEGYIFKSPVTINLYFNDKEQEHINQLKLNIEEFGYRKDLINIYYSCSDFEELYPKIHQISNKSANLIFLDQFGIKYVNQEKFIEICQLSVTDLIFFISSTTFKRFHSDQNIYKVLNLTPDEIQNEEFYKIHRLVHKAYSSFIPEGHSYGLAPFSIKKGSNVYGLIFGSGHPLGLEKFLDICWLKDETTGEANFDIQGDVKLRHQPSLFAAEEAKTLKIDIFQSELEKAILNGELTSDLQIYLFALNRGFTNKHISPIIKKLKTEKKIDLKYPSFKCGTVWDRKRTPRVIQINN